MILDQLSQWETYAGCVLQLGKAIDFLSTCNEQTPSGTYELDGKKVYAMVSEYDTVEDPLWENHRAYIDIQVLLSGTERVQWAPSSELAVVKPYDAEKDIARYSGAAKLEFALIPGQFAVFFPADGHRVKLHANGPGHVKKAVIKIALDA